MRKPLEEKYGPNQFKSLKITGIITYLNQIQFIHIIVNIFHSNLVVVPLFFNLYLLIYAHFLYILNHKS